MFLFEILIITNKEPFEIMEELKILEGDTQNNEENFTDVDILLVKVDNIIVEHKKFLSEFEKRENKSEEVVQKKNEINELERDKSKVKQNTVRKKKHRWIGDLVFNILLFGMVIGALILKDIDKDIPKSIAGISIFTVLTGSMENEIPKGSLVVAKYMKPSELKIGDDITFMVSKTTTITHRIIGIIENYEQTGQRAFETKGTMNKDKDKLPVPAVNVIGKVVYHNYTLGRIRDFISQNIIIILVMMVLIWALSYVLKSIFKKDIKETMSASTLEQK